MLSSIAILLFACPEPRAVTVDASDPSGAPVGVIMDKERSVFIRGRKFEIAESKHGRLSARCHELNVTVQADSRDELCRLAKRLIEVMELELYSEVT